MKYTQQLKLQIAKEYFSDKTSITKLVKKYGLDKSKVSYCIKLYELHGETPFTDRQASRVYTREEKLIAIKTVLAKEKSSRQVAAELGVPNPRTVQDWVNKYIKEGEDGIQISSGRKSYMLHEDRQRYLAEKELKERINFLELENDYLKKLYSLIQEKNLQSKKK